MPDPNDDDTRTTGNDSDSARADAKLTEFANVIGCDDLDVAQVFLDQYGGDVADALEAAFFDDGDDDEWETYSARPGGTAVAAAFEHDDDDGETDSAAVAAAFERDENERDLQERLQAFVGAFLVKYPDLKPAVLTWVPKILLGTSISAKIVDEILKRLGRLGAFIEAFLEEFPELKDRLMARFAMILKCAPVSAKVAEAEAFVADVVKRFDAGDFVGAGTNVAGALLCDGATWTLCPYSWVRHSDANVTFERSKIQVGPPDHKAPFARLTYSWTPGWPKYKSCRTHEGATNFLAMVRKRADSFWNVFDSEWDGVFHAFDVLARVLHKEDQYTFTKNRRTGKVQKSLVCPGWPGKAEASVHLTMDLAFNFPLDYDNVFPQGVAVNKFYKKRAKANGWKVGMLSAKIRRAGGIDPNLTKYNGTQEKGIDVWGIGFSINEHYMYFNTPSTGTGDTIWGRAAAFQGGPQYAAVTVTEQANFFRMLELQEFISYGECAFAGNPVTPQLLREAAIYMSNGGLAADREASAQKKKDTRAKRDPDLDGEARRRAAISVSLSDAARQKGERQGTLVHVSEYKDGSFKYDYKNAIGPGGTRTGVDFRKYGMRSEPEAAVAPNLALTEKGYPVVNEVWIKKHPDAVAEATKALERLK